LCKFYLISITESVRLSRSGRFPIQPRAVRTIQIDKENIPGLDQDTGMPTGDTEISGSKPCEINGHVIFRIVRLAASNDEFRFNRHD
jgi:hypothetical protein